MTRNIAIIGLGQIGASIGLALKAKQNPPRVLGFDNDAAAARAAQILGAVDAASSLKGAVREAELVILCLPLSAIRETLAKVGPLLKEEAVLMDTAPVKGAVVRWVHEFLPAGRYYLGLVPAITTDAFSTVEGGTKGARADLFERTVMVVDAPQGTPSEVERLAMNLARLLGAKPLLADLAESDGLMTTVHVLPQLAAAALLEACVDAPGWMDARKLAGRPFVNVTGGLAYYDDPASLKIAALANPLAVSRGLAAMIASLQSMRDDIEDGNEQGLGDRLNDSFQARERWLNERGLAEWLKEGGETAELPAIGEQMTQMLFGSRIADRLKRKK